ncbi:glucosaminidase domain-containing protein [Paenibacillus radicis (ex Gao et al. 2016)]|uniref:Uncharacterized protein n=1 Tax=Paenibacillus radicis (ex Gao et al. 2016) TaxID=1737354 RepID=A0A917HSS3_9BACL|nr:glucosaminidase domain-containing protein [Paenibacillus radicis (ex Gao et al. 2016)]GGG88310.1 hypothetical protein GCM10010918_53500 [Paenibacillus radicis (ex Gao et al. 2016)]
MTAEKAYVLSPSDVSNIRRYVQHKYAAMTQEKKAEIVADAVNRTIHRQLPAFDDDVKRSLTASLIRQIVVERQMPVHTDDIFEACLTLNREEASIREPLRLWIEQQAGASLSPERFDSLMDELTSPEPLHALRSPVAWERLKSILSDAEALPAQSGALAEVINLPVANKELIPATRIRPAIYALLCLLLFGATLAYGWSAASSRSAGKAAEQLSEPAAPLAKPAIDGLPAELRYTKVDEKKLAVYLAGKSSVLAEQPYLGAIIAAAEQFDIHPLILFAITGQEQAFVPTTKKQAKQIANNPFNVFHSWQEYNTTIDDSATIAARTIFNLSKGRPEDVDPFTWINRKYAEDPGWSKGVRTIFGTMKRHLETPSQSKEAMD